MRHLLAVALTTLALSARAEDPACWIQKAFNNGGSTNCDDAVDARPARRAARRAAAVPEDRPSARPAARASAQPAARRPAPAAADLNFENPLAFLGDMFSGFNSQKERYSTSREGRANCPSGNTRIVASVSNNYLALYCGAELMREFRVATGGRNRETGALYRTPLGDKRIIEKNPDSKYHKALVFQAAGVYEIHGLPPGRPDIEEYHPGNWTKGCLAVTNEEMDWLYARVRQGTPIRIEP